MGLLDFFRKNKNVTTKTSKKTVGDYTITTTVTMRRGPDVYVDGPGPDYPIPKDTLRDLKVYNEDVKHPCGFDFSAVRRHKRSASAWWLEDGNYDRAINALLSLKPYEDMARAERPGFPHAIDIIADMSAPYSVGADGNLVPVIYMETTKKRGTSAVVRFSIMPTENGPATTSSIYFFDDGSIREASVSHYDKYGTGSWSFSVDTPKRTGVLTYKGSSFIEPKS